MKMPSVTKRDQLQYPSYTDHAIAGIKLIASLTDKQLLSVVESDSESKTFKSILVAMGPTTNPYWIIGTVAEIAYDRHVIDERTLDRIMGD